MIMMTVTWGTWEELVLGGAVLRHGTRAWGAVASELRARTLFPYVFTPEECKAKYEDLQERYSGCNAWFEELRKQRVAELRRELEKSEGSIGSLQSKLESLKAEKEDSNADYDSSQTESLVPPGNLEGVESSGKETSKDEPSAGSFTEETRKDWSPEPQVPVVESAKENESKTEILDDSEKEKTSCWNPEVSRGSMKKRRGKRKRKECKEVKEGSVGESDVMSSANVVASRNREECSGGCEHNVQVSCEESGGACKEEEAADLARILDSVMEHDDVSVFRRRLESQRRARYKKLIRRHMDLDTIRSRIEDGSISSSKQLYRDLLLLSNNALLFYAKDSKEHKSALSLRNSAGKIFQQKPKDSSIQDSSKVGKISEQKPMDSSIQDSSKVVKISEQKPMDSSTQDSSKVVKISEQKSKDSSIQDSSKVVKLASHVRNPVKPRSVRPCSHKIAGKVVVPGIPKLTPKLESKKGCGANVPPRKVVSPGTPKLEGKKGSGANVPPAVKSPVVKSSGRPAKGARESGQKQTDVPAKWRKRARKR